MYKELIRGLRDKAEFLRNANRDSSIHNSFAETMSQAADAIEVLDMKLQGSNAAIAGMQREIERMVIDSANSKPQWIRFTIRPLTEEEKEEHPEWAYILDCKLPDDGQDILVSNGRWVTVDTFFSDDGCYLDSNGDLEGLWWMPLPEQPKEET